MMTQILARNQTRPGMNTRPSGACQPPRNRILASPAIMIMFMYSPRKNMAKDIALYSTKKPATISLFAFRQIERRAVRLCKHGDEEHHEHREHGKTEPDMALRLYDVVQVQAADAQQGR